MVTGLSEQPKSNDYSRIEQFLDADVLLSDAQTLRYLVGLRQPIVAPMVRSDGLYSNFWAGMSANYYYERKPEYKEIYEYSKSGEFAVPMVHSAVLLHLRDPRTDALTFDRRRLLDIGEEERSTIPQDDIIVLAVAANRSALPMLVSNARRFGFVLAPLNLDDTLNQDHRQLTNVKVMAINELGKGIEVLDVLQQFVLLPQRSRVGLDSIVTINLERRPERRQRMEHNFHEMGLDAELLPAVDGSLLTPERLVELGVKVLPSYADPYHKRPMTLGEIGCFLSHFWVWEEVLKRGDKKVLVLEDDILFDTYFRDRLVVLLEEADQIGGWDLIYLGRKRLQNQEEKFVAGSQLLVLPSYSYWTLGYIITQQGVQKLLGKCVCFECVCEAYANRFVRFAAAEPLSKLLPIDEFLPIMFDQHVNDTWKSHFAERNLVAWSAAPLLIYPTHYTGESGYISDTEDSAWLQQQRDSGIADEEDAEKKGKRESYEFTDVDALVNSPPVDEDALFEGFENDADILTVDLPVAEAKTEL